MSEVLHISARDNPLLVRVRKLARDPGAYRKAGLVWVEGEHLLLALAARGLAPSQTVVAESAWAMPATRTLVARSPRVAVVSDTLFAGLSAMPSPSQVGMLWPVPAAAPLQPGLATVVLDRLQDAGNVGSVLRSAAAFGVRQVLALKGTAALWSPKVVRAGMGAHFSLVLHEGLEPAALDMLRVPLLGTSLHASVPLAQAALPHPCAWLMGHEGQGIAPELLARCAFSVHIPLPGGEESLNVAAAAAVCLYESSRRRRASGQ